MLYKQILRPALFKFSGDAEDAHERAMHVLEKVAMNPFLRVLVESICLPRKQGLAGTVFGIQFPNPIGLAGGFDKNGKVLPALQALGFGFVEVGTVTYHPQPGNPRPRLFRFPKDEAIINRMGFNNDGAAELARRLKDYRNSGVLRIPIGISLGKSKVTPVETATEDYIQSLHLLHEWGDYFAVNVSSPNTPGLRQLQDKEMLRELVSSLMKESQKLAEQGRRKPLLVKLAPDLTTEALDEALQVCSDCGVDGIIAINTTISREGLSTSTSEAGGLSGRPLRGKALEVVSHIRRMFPSMPIIGVGGIFTGDHAQAMLDAGADLVQLYTGLIYEGPMIVKKIAAKLRA